MTPLCHQPEAHPWHILLFCVVQVRNAALSPLERTRHYPAGFPADKIVFLNDVSELMLQMQRP
jgi:hypothetical protein